MTEDSEERILRPGDVARLFGIAPQTVGRWARLGRLPHTTTAGGHRRFRESEIRALLDGGEEE